MSKDSVKTTRLYEVGCRAVGNLTRYVLFLNTEPNRLDMIKRMGELEDLEESVLELAEVIKEAKGKLNAMFTLDGPSDANNET